MCLAQIAARFVAWGLAFAYDLDRPIAFDHLICDRINADCG